MIAWEQHAKAHRSRQKFGLQSTTVWLGEHEDPEIANPVTLWRGPSDIRTWPGEAGGGVTFSSAT